MIGILPWSRMQKLPLARIVAAASLCAGAAHAALQPLQVADLADLSLEQLAEVSVTSATRRPERLAEVPASVFVITRDDIRRSGATTLPEVLRLAPNLHVGRTDTTQYAISARGGNANLANKMLVLVDGRTIYSPIFSGVFWDAQDILVEDIERIEVVSGPGATLWGTNAVNGVISITTLASSRTQGPMASAGAGGRERTVAVRHGGKLGPDAHYRLHAKHDDRDGLQGEGGGSLQDPGHRSQLGFRADWQRGAGDLTLQGDAYRGTHDSLLGRRELSGANLVGRWSGRDPRDFRVQVYLDRTERDQRGVFRETRNTFDIEGNRLTTLANHAVVWGAGYRASRDRIGNSAAIAFLPERRTLEWANVFLQDEVTLASNLKATLGLRLEHNTFTGLEWLPNARVGWQPSPTSLAWVAASRAVRAPSRIDRDLFFPGTPPYERIAGGPGFESEVAEVTELGYRAQPSPAFTFSTTLFHHRFDDLRSIELVGGRNVIANGFEGRLRGIEGWGSWRALPNLQLAAGFVALSERFDTRPGVVDLGGRPSLGNDPRRTAFVRLQWDATTDWQLDMAARHVGRVPDPVVPAYTAVDARVGWRITPRLEASLRVENLLGRRFAEFEAPGTRAVFGRTWFLRFTWHG